MLLHLPWGLLSAVVAICALGVWNLASAARSMHQSMWLTQSAYMGVGFAALATTCLFSYRWVQKATPAIYVLNILALVALHFIGHKAKGAESWFAIGPLRIQPAEFMKIGMVLMLAKFYNDDYRSSESNYSLIRLIRPTLLFAVPTVLVLIQPDLGTAMMMIFTWVTMVLFAGIQRWVVIVVAVLSLVGGVVLWHDYIREGGENHATWFRHHLKRHQDLRISGWLNPETDTKGSNYHAAQSKIAVGSGGLTGKGWKKGTQTGLFFLPEQHTDFIFSVWAEEHGFIACVGLLMLYGMVFLFALEVAFQTRDRFGVFVAVGVTAMIFWQVFENVGMVIGLLPVTGITLPLMSYGGSSVVSVMIGVGLLVNISMRRHVF